MTLGGHWSDAIRLVSSFHLVGRVQFHADRFQAYQHKLRVLLDSHVEPALLAGT